MRESLCYRHFARILFTKPFFSRVSDTYNLTRGDIDNFVSGESSEYALVQLANIGVSQYELLFEDDLIPSPDLMTMKQKENSTFSAPDAGKTTFLQILWLNLRIQSLERLTPDDPRF